MESKCKLNWDPGRLHLIQSKTISNAVNVNDLKPLDINSLPGTGSVSSCINYVSGSRKLNFQPKRQDTCCTNKHSHDIQLTQRQTECDPPRSDDSRRWSEAAIIQGRTYRTRCSSIEKIHRMNGKNERRHTDRSLSVTKVHLQWSLTK